MYEIIKIKVMNFVFNFELYVFKFEFCFYFSILLQFFFFLNKRFSKLFKDIILKKLLFINIILYSKMIKQYKNNIH